MTDYPSNYKWYVLAYYTSGSARTKYKGDSVVECKAALIKARAAKNIESVSVFKNGKELGK